MPTGFLLAAAGFRSLRLRIQKAKNPQRNANEINASAGCLMTSTRTAISRSPIAQPKTARPAVTVRRNKNQCRAEHLDGTSEIPEPLSGFQLDRRKQPTGHSAQPENLSAPNKRKISAIPPRITQSVSELRNARSLVDLRACLLPTSNGIQIRMSPNLATQAPGLIPDDRTVRTPLPSQNHAVFYASASSTADARTFSPAATSAPRCTRMARLPRDSKTARSPAA